MKLDLRDMWSRADSGQQMSLEEEVLTVTQEENDAENSDSDQIAGNITLTTSRSQTQTGPEQVVTSSEGTTRGTLTKSQSLTPTTGSSLSSRRGSLTQSHSFPPNKDSPQFSSSGDAAFNDLVHIQAPTSEESSNSNSNGIGNSSHHSDTDVIITSNTFTTTNVISNDVITSASTSTPTLPFACRGQAARGSPAERPRETGNARGSVDRRPFVQPTRDC